VQQYITGYSALDALSINTALLQSSIQVPHDLREQAQKMLVEKGLSL
jgi:hypothetical protein